MAMDKNIKLTINEKSALKQTNYDRGVMARYIDADKLIHKLQEAARCKGIGATIASIVIQLIESLPTAEVVEVKHGEWVRVADTYGKEYLCSACKGGIRQYIGQPYCSSCGAKMDGGNKE